MWILTFLHLYLPENPWTTLHPKGEFPPCLHVPSTNPELAQWAGSKWLSPEWLQMSEWLFGLFGSLCSGSEGGKVAVVTRCCPWWLALPVPGRTVTGPFRHRKLARRLPSQAAFVPGLGASWPNSDDLPASLALPGCLIWKSGLCVPPGCTSFPWCGGNLCFLPGTPCPPSCVAPRAIPQDLSTTSNSKQTLFFLAKSELETKL